MPLSSGARLGPYEIVAPIGAGGMGEVYRARDTRLQRLVALKVVPASIAADADALARFEREAQAVAALSHPNILALHDIGHENATTFAVMELLEGRTLREILTDGPLPTRKAIEYGRQIADGLAAAHDRSIVHRDLKPENIFVTVDGRVKLLDFGLALMQRPAPSSADTVLAKVDTTPGTILGTIGYMAPEQVRGQVVDSRADIFSFGAVLYEMLGGKRAFGGATAADTMSAILNADPHDFVPSSGGSHPGLERIVRRALEKEPAQRFHSARDLGFALEAVASGSGATVNPVPAASPATRQRRLLPVVAALVLGAILGAAGWQAWSTGPEEPPAGVSRFTLSASAFQVGVEWVAVSPDGRTLAWGGNTSSASSQALALWVRRLDTLSAEVVRNVTDVRRAVFLSDNKTLLCVGVNSVFTIDIETGRRAMRWTSPDERARLFATVAVGPGDAIAMGIGTGIGLLDNGTLRMLETAQEGEFVGFPGWMPGGKELLFSARHSDRSVTVFVIPRDGGARRPLSLPQDITAPVVMPDGSVLYGQSGILWGQRLAPGTWEPIGPPVRIASDLSMDISSGFMGVSVSQTGLLVFRSPSVSQVQFEWVDRSGRLERAVGAPDSFTNFDVARTGVVAATRREPFANGNSLWLLDPARQLTRQIGAFEGASFSDPTFSPDGTRVAVRKGGKIIIHTLQGATEMVLRDWLGYPDSWSRDGRFLTVGRPVGSDYQLWAIDVDDPSRDAVQVEGVALADEGRFSPDGKWIAYHAAQTTTAEVFVAPFPATGERLQISTNGGVQPRWSPDGSELYFLDLSGQIMSAVMPGGNPRNARVPVPLFRTTLVASSAIDEFAVSADGTRFLTRRPVEAASNDAPVQVVLNWPALFPARSK